MLLELRNVTKVFTPRGKPPVRAVDDVSFSIPEGSTFGLVGESGSGKTTVARIIPRLTEPTSGEVLFEGRSLLHLTEKQMNAAREQIQIIFQNPYSSLNPRMTVRKLIGEPLLVHHKASGAALDRRVLEMMELVGLKPEHANRFPHEFSGGQRQRIGIARALILQSQAADPRRADLGARRLGPGPGAQPVDRPAAETRPDLPADHARPGCGALSLRPRRALVLGDHRRKRHAGPGFPASRSIPTPRRCCATCPRPTPTSRCSPTSISNQTSTAPAGPAKAAASPPAALPPRSTPATNSSRSWSPSATATRSPATWPMRAFTRIFARPPCYKRVVARLPLDIASWVGYSDDTKGCKF